MTNDATHRYTLALEIGEEAIRQGKWQQALTCFQTALTGLPREPRVYNGLGDTHMALSDRGRALACYKEAARLAGDNAEYVNKVAVAQEHLGMIPDAARSLLISGDLFWSQGQFERAEAQWTHAVALREDLIAPRERLALACRQRGDEDAAIGHFLDLADILRHDGRCLMALHICYTVMADRPADTTRVWAATNQAWRCVALRDRREDPQSARVEPGDLINAAAEFAQWQLAAEIRQSAHANGHSPNPEALILLRQAMLNEGYGQAGVAISFYEKAIATGLDSPAIFFTLGLIYRLVGRKQDARAAHLLAARHPFYRDAVALLE